MDFILKKDVKKSQLFFAIYCLILIVFIAAKYKAVNDQGEQLPPKRCWYTATQNNFATNASNNY